MKKITIEIPDDCEVKIVKKEEKEKPIIRTYQDLIDSGKRLKGYVISNFSEINNIELWAMNSTKHLAISKKVAKSMLAMAQISQLIPYYGGEINDEKWKERTCKYTISKIKDKIEKDTACETYRYLAFHTAEQRDNFLKYNEQLVKDYLMID